MGTLLGHLIPGTMFLVVGLWWTWNIFKIYYKSKCKNGKQFHSLPWYPVLFCKNFPLESAAKVGLTALGLTGELKTEILNGFYRFMNNAQHMTMYFFFGLAGAVELLKHYSSILPDNIDRLSAILALAMEGFIFQNHTHGLKPMEVHVHVLLFYLIMGCTLSAILEMMHQNSFIFSFSKAYFIMLQATWFYQTGFILYPPFGLRRWDLEDHGQMAYVSLIFTFHVGVVFLLMLLLGGCVWVHMKKTKQLDEINYHVIPSDLVLTSTPVKVNGHTEKIHELQDSDNEFV